ncbi:MAG: glycerol-3-phosphate 1-O-acyltransferase PlsY [Candidatus Omnitrophica bacterium]|nr:glycerol-3-phosphate 1-O-acyltransferase PlsY [Candidatus Omnitrophota bacterium]
MISLIISLTLAYLIGSIPTSYIFAKALKKIDIREHGSGNVGATNVFRTVGKIPGIIVLLIDVAKGVVAVSLLSEVFLSNWTGVILGLEFYKILLGMCAIAGHVFSVFLRFKGGKGIATTGGVLIALAPGTLLACLAIWIIVFAVFRIVSIASIIASLSLPIFAVIFYRSFYFVIFCVILCLASVYKHKANIKRLLRGEEKRLI